MCSCGESFRQGKADPYCFLLCVLWSVTGLKFEYANGELLDDQKPNSTKLYGPCPSCVSLSHVMCRNSQSGSGGIVVVFFFKCYLPISSSWQCVIFFLNSFKCLAIFVMSLMSLVEKPGLHSIKWRLVTLILGPESSWLAFLQ